MSATSTIFWTVVVVVAISLYVAKGGGKVSDFWLAILKIVGAIAGLLFLYGFAIKWLGWM